MSSTTNRFLISGLNNENLATEKTLDDLNTFMQSGALTVQTAMSTVSVDNFPSVQAISFDPSNQTGDLSTKINSVNGGFLNGGTAFNVHLSRLNGDVVSTGTGSNTSHTIRAILTDDYLSSVSSAITDVDFNGGSQTDDLNVIINQTSTVDISRDVLDNMDRNIKDCDGQLIQIYSLLANRTPSGLGQKNKANSFAVTLATDEDQLDTNVAQVGGSNIALGNTTASASLPVTMASDQSDINVDLNSINSTYLTGTDKLKMDMVFLGANTIKTGSGDSTSAAGLQRVVLTNDFVSAVTQASYIEESLNYYMSEFEINSMVNLAQDLSVSGDGNTNVYGGFLGGSDIYLDKLQLTLTIDGVVDAETWGSSGGLLTNGMTIAYKTSSVSSQFYLSGAATSIYANRDLIRVFDRLDYHEFGTGATILKFTLVFDKKIKIDDTGDVYISMPPDDYTDSGNVTAMEANLYYWS